MQTIRCTISKLYIQKYIKYYRNKTSQERCNAYMMYKYDKHILQYVLNYNNMVFSYEKKITATGDDATI